MSFSSPLRLGLNCMTGLGRCLAMGPRVDQPTNSMVGGEEEDMLGGQRLHEASLYACQVYSLY